MRRDMRNLRHHIVPKYVLRGMSNDRFLFSLLLDISTFGV